MADWSSVVPTAALVTVAAGVVAYYRDQSIARRRLALALKTEVLSKIAALQPLYTEAYWARVESMLNSGDFPRFVVDENARMLFKANEKELSALHGSVLQRVILFYRIDGMLDQAFKEMNSDEFKSPSIDVKRRLALVGSVRALILPNLRKASRGALLGLTMQREMTWIDWLRFDPRRSFAPGWPKGKIARARADVRRYVP